MRGSFHITCDRRQDGTTAIGRQQISAPWHLSKPYWDGQSLLVQSVNMTAGVFAGDELSFDVRVNPEASVLLTSPSASRIHTMPEGRATQKQHIAVDNKAWLEWMPELFIPQRRSRYEQTTTIDVEDDGSIYAAETFAPGRVAHGETFAFQSVFWSTQVTYHRQLVLREAFQLSPENSSLYDLKRRGEAAYYASVIIIHKGLPTIRKLQDGLDGMFPKELQLGLTSFDSCVMQAKLLAPSSHVLKEGMLTLRNYFRTFLPGLSSSPRKL